MGLFVFIDMTLGLLMLVFFFIMCWYSFKNKVPLKHTIRLVARRIDYVKLKPSILGYILIFLVLPFTSIALAVFEVSYNNSIRI